MLFEPLSTRAIRQRIGRRARDARLAARRSQAELAKAAGVSLPTLRRFEAGASVTLDVVIRVAIALNCERELRELFPPPDLRTIDDVLKRKHVPRRARAL